MLVRLLKGSGRIASHITAELNAVMLQTSNLREHTRRPRQLVAGRKLKGHEYGFIGQAVFPHLFNHILNTELVNNDLYK